MRIVYRLLFALHAFVGIGALAGGMAAISNPQEPLCCEVEKIKRRLQKKSLLYAYRSYNTNGGFYCLYFWVGPSIY